MKKKTKTALGGALLFALCAAAMGSYQLAGVSAALAVILLAGASLEPLYAVLAAAAYLLIGVWLPVYPGAARGTAFLLGSSGGFLLALPFCALAIAAMRKAMRQNPLPALAVGLCMAFFLYFGIGILWHIVKTGATFQAVFTSKLFTPFLLFGVDSLLTIVLAPYIRKLTK